LGGPFNGLLTPLRINHSRVVKADMSKGEPVWAWYIRRRRVSEKLWEYEFEKAERGGWPDDPDDDLAR
jgi:hypothetical protein